MQPIPFSQVQATQSKIVVQAVAGVITQVYKMEHKPGQGQYSPFTIQKIMIQEQGTNALLRASLFDADEISPGSVGQGFFATSGTNLKGAPCGLYADHYQSQSQGMIYGIKCSKGGSIFINGQPWSAGKVAQPTVQAPVVAPQWGPQTQFQPQPQPQQYQPAPIAPVSVPQMGMAPAHIEQKNPLSFLMSQSAAYVMCFEAAMRVREQLQIELEQGPGEPLSTSDVKEIATTFYIEGNRKGVFASVVGNMTAPVNQEPSDQP